MEIVHQCGKSGLQVLLIRGLGSERDRAEREVLEAGIPLALSNRAVWAPLHRWEPWFLLVRDASGHARAGVAIEVGSSDRGHRPHVAASGGRNSGGR